ncbi:protein PAT1 homolog 1-like [Watersipora subatra]|uniref:protein PAT1 homolog 1-like n=1 Tax=Watersipora subatra TaxID=2589382 RepID=UPI00355C7ECA
MDLFNQSAVGSRSADEDYDLLNDETFGDVQEAFDWEFSNSLAEAGSTNKTDTTKLEMGMNELELAEDTIDSAIISSNSKKIPTSSRGGSHSSLYDTQSPPAFVSNIDDLLHPDRDIWGSPPSSAPNVVPEAKTSEPDSVRDAYLSTSLEKAKSFLPSLPVTRKTNSGSPVAMPKNAMTVEELERQMNSEPVPVPKTRSDHTSPLLAGSRVHSTPTPPQVWHPLSASPQMNGMHISRSRPLPGLSPLPGDVRVRPPITILQRPQNMDPQLQQRMGGSALLQQRTMYDAPPGFNSRYPFMPRGRMPVPAMVRMPPQRPGFVQPRFLARQNIAPMYMLADEPPRDEYAGILTKSEKDWLIKIQMLQLHTEDPYTDDYYYTIHNLEKAQADPEASNQASLILPAMAKMESRQYTPVQFEKSLGRLTSSSVHNPRQVLDVGEKGDHVIHALSDTKKYRISLSIAEKGYQLLLDLDELKKKIPSLPEEQRSTLLLAYKKKQLKLHQLVDEEWSAMLNIRKGRSLILRTLPLLDRHSTKHLMQRLLTGLPYIIKKELADGMEPKSCRYLVEILQLYDISSLLQLSDLITPHISSLITTSFGCHLVFLMINQAEKIYSAYVEVNEDETSSWNRFVDQLLDAFTSCSKLPKASRIPTSVRDHISRRPANEQVLQRISGWLD